MSGIECSDGPTMGALKRFCDIEGTYAESRAFPDPDGGYRETLAPALPDGSYGSALPTDAAERKAVPIASGVIDYFPAALAEIAKVSKAGNDQHRAGKPLHWERGKSMDQADCIMRHFIERGTIDTDNLRHSAKMAWRALALLQLEMEEAGAPIARGAV